jgi:hypothetical protein
MRAHDLILLLALLVPATSMAADQTPAPAPVTGGGGVDALVESDLQTLEDPSLSSPVRRTKLQAILEATQTDSRAAIEIGFAGRKEPERLRATLKLAGPLSQDTDRSELATLKGLAGQTSVTLGLRRLGKTREEIREAVVQKLTAAIGKDPIAFRNKLESAWKAENPGVAVPSSLSTDDLSARGRRNFLRGIDATGGSFFFAGEATYAVPKAFSFAVPETLERRQEEHDAYSGTLSAGWLPVVSPLPYVGLSFTYEDSFEGQGKQQICEPFGPQGSLRCQSLALGAPRQVEKQLLQLESRRFFPRATSAIGLRLSRDFKNDVTGVELPVWVLRDASGLLNGGVALGWRSDTEEWTFSAFVGSPFGK